MGEFKKHNHKPTKSCSEACPRNVRHINPCQRCGANAAFDVPPNQERCGACPPLPCEDCGQPTNEPCGCYTKIDGRLSLAELKGLFAQGDMSLSPAERMNQVILDHVWATPPDQDDEAIRQALLEQRIVDEGYDPDAEVRDA